MILTLLMDEFPPKLNRPIWPKYLSAPASLILLKFMTSSCLGSDKQHFEPGENSAQHSWKATGPHAR